MFKYVACLAQAVLAISWRDEGPPDAKTYFLESDFDINAQDFSALTAGATLPSGWTTSGNSDWTVTTNTKFGASATSF